MDQESGPPEPGPPSDRDEVDAAFAHHLDRLAVEQGSRAVADCVALLDRTSLAATELACLRAFCRRLYDERRLSFLVALEAALRAAPAAPPDGAAIVAVYAVRAQLERQCYLAVETLHETALTPHRGRGAYAPWEERYFNEALANALMKQARAEEALAVIDAGLAAAPTHAALRVIRARLLASIEPALALAELRRAESDARDAKESLPAASLLSAALASALGQGADAEQALQSALEGASPHPDLHLALANLALAEGRFDEQRRRIDDWFAHFGLWSPASVGDGPFRIGAIPPSGLQRREDGPLVSVVMTAFNAADTVGYAAASVLDQTHANLELFIVDDASTDATRERLVAIAARDPRVRLAFNDANVGPYVSKNRAIERAAGAFVTFHDADDWRHPEHLERHVALMSAEPGLAASRSAWSRVEAEGGFVLMPWGAYGHANPAATMIRRELFAEIGVFDSVRVGADTELWARIEARYGAARRVDLPAPLALGLSHGRSLTSAGPAAIGPDGASAPRLAYWESQARWRDAMWLAGEPLFMPFPLAERPFPAPGEILPWRRDLLEDGAAGMGPVAGGPRRRSGETGGC
jgi:tetratricopeptide (TPR) repeat protein